jgi:hypothetical protein
VDVTVVRLLHQWIVKMMILGQIALKRAMNVTLQALELVFIKLHIAAVLMLEMDV